jgi:hypothetical protein
MSVHDSLKVALSELAAARAGQALVKQSLKDAQAAFEAAHAPLIASVSEYSAKVAEAENVVRKLALVAYEADKENKTPVEGVTIKVGKLRTYDPTRVLEWARKNRETFPALIVETLDEKVLKALITANAVPGVTVADDPKATIDTNLSDYLNIPEPAAHAAELTDVL